MTDEGGGGRGAVECRILEKIVVWESGDLV